MTRLPLLALVFATKSSIDEFDDAVVVVEILFGGDKLLLAMCGVFVDLPFDWYPKNPFLQGNLA